MPRTTQAQQVGEAGVTAVLEKCTACGWSGEFVLKDFGEDLVFQTNFKRVIDPFRIYAQVKSFSYTPITIRVSQQHLSKWLMTGELLVLFVYIKETREIWYCSVNERLSFSQVLLKPAITIGLNLQEHFLPLTPTRVLELEWLSRRRGLDFLFSRIHSEQSIRPLDRDLLHEEVSVAVLMLKYMSMVYTQKNRAKLTTHDLFMAKIVEIVSNKE